MSDVVDMTERRNAQIDAEVPWFTGLALCLACTHRWIATVSAHVNMFKLECPNCKSQDSFCSILPDKFNGGVK